MPATGLTNPLEPVWINRLLEDINAEWWKTGSADISAAHLERLVLGHGHRCRYWHPAASSLLKSGDAVMEREENGR
jgi:hypothetical protein